MMNISRWELMATILLAYLFLVGGLSQARPANTADDASQAMEGVPSDAFAFVSVRVAYLWKSEVGNDLRQLIAKEQSRVLETLGAWGMMPDRIDRATVILSTVQDWPPLALIATIKPFEREKLIQALGGEVEEKMVGDKSYHEGKRGTALHFVNDRLFLVGQGNQVKEYLEGAGKKKAAGPLAGALRLAAKKHPVVAGMVPSALAPLLGQLAPPWQGLQPLLAAESTDMSIDVSPETQISFRLGFAKKEQVKEGVKAAKAGLEMAHEFLSQFLAKQFDPEIEADFPHCGKLIAEFVKALKSVTVSPKEVAVEISLPIRTNQATLSGALPEIVVGLFAGYSVEGTFSGDKDETEDHLKQLSLAMHKFHQKNRHLPTNAIVSKDGKPLLSWRVALLPYLDQEDLYKQFKLDEPWDGPNNKKLIDKMPEVFKGYGSSRVDHMPATRFRVFSGPGAAFEGNKKLGLADFTDGLSTTFLIVGASRPVPWTKPDILPFVPGKPLPKLSGWSSGEQGFHAVFADGTVHFIKKDTDEKTIRAYITRNGREKVKDPE